MTKAEEAFPDPLHRLVALSLRGDRKREGHRQIGKTAIGPITPTLAITPVGSVDETHAATLQFEGTSTRFDGQSLRLEVKAQGSATVLKSGIATVQAGGTWTSDAMDMSHQTNGTYTVIVTGTNSAGIEVSESQSFTLAQSGGRRNVAARYLKVASTSAGSRDSQRDRGRAPDAQ